jgi:hypothetical protein
MAQDHSSAEAAYSQFDKMRWSMVLEAVQSRAPGARKALAELRGLYWRPLYGFVRDRGRGPENAQDLVQSFLKYLIGSRGLATVPARLYSCARRAPAARCPRAHSR